MREQRKTEEKADKPGAGGGHGMTHEKWFLRGVVGAMTKRSTRRRRYRTLAYEPERAEPGEAELSDARKSM